MKKFTIVMMAAMTVATAAIAQMAPTKTGD